MSYSFIIWPDRLGQFRLTFKAPNGQIIFTTEGYANKAGALHAANLVKVYGPVAPVNS
jgi:uncharacterized protein YegP (UPF0339 family)